MNNVIQLNTPRRKEACLKHLKQTRKHLPDDEAESWKRDMFDFLIERIEAGRGEDQAGALLSAAL